MQYTGSARDATIYRTIVHQNDILSKPQFIEFY